MATTQPTVTLHHLAHLTQKLYDADSDIRYMSLNDLSAVFQTPNSSLLTHDYNQCAKVVDGFLHTLNDPNGEVQNMTIKCLGSFVLKVHPDILCPMIHKLANLSTENTIDSSISALAVRAVIVALPRPTPGVPRTKAVLDAYNAISKVLIPRLVGYIVLPHSTDRARQAPPKGLLQEDLEKGTDSNSMDVLIEVARCFGPMLHEKELHALHSISSELFESARTASVMKKKAITALTTIAQYFTDLALSTYIGNLIEKINMPHLLPAQHKLYMAMLGTMARTIPKQLSGHLKTLAPFVLSVLSPQQFDEEMDNAEEGERDSQIDEVKEAALVTLDSFLSNCRDVMERYNNDCIEAALLYLKYDPNIAMDDNDEAVAEADEEDDFDLDEDFEEEGGADDEDDLSWKVRRCAAKLLDTIISVRGIALLENAVMYERIASSLIARFKEREEAVRLEILATTGRLIRQSSESHSTLDAPVLNGLEHNLPISVPTRKRRRGQSDASMMDVSKHRRVTGSLSPEAELAPIEGPSASLARISPQLIRAALALFDKNTTAAIKQAVFTLVKNLVQSRPAGFDKNIEGLLNPLVETITLSDQQKSTFAGSLQTGASNSNLRITALQLLGEVLKTHSSRTLQPYMAKIVPAVILAMKTKNPKVSIEASVTAEQVVKALTPPRSASSNRESIGQIALVLQTAEDLVTARDGDVEVRRSAIRNISLLLGRCSRSGGSSLLTTEQQSRSLQILWETLNNETTRFCSIKAIGQVASLFSETGCFTAEWYSKVCLELGAQLRKSSRLLRASSLAALHALLIESRCQLLDVEPARQLSSLLQPLLTTSDLQLVAPVLDTYKVLVRSHGDVMVNDAFIKDLSALVASPLASSTLEDLILLVQTIAKQGKGQQLMQILLEGAGLKGSPIIIGKIIGNTLVSGGDSAGVSVQNFLNELKSDGDTQKKQLALSVLGEVGLRSGSSLLSPELFISYFASPSEKVRLAAATALGRTAAGAGNVQTYVPAILSRIQQNPTERYIILHSMDEILQNESISHDILPFTGALWDASVAASQTEDNKTIGAECISNLVLIDPKRFLPVLHSLLANNQEGVRGLGIAALRNVFASSDGSYDQDLRPIIVEVLTTMLRDSGLENRRSALNAFNAAARNKPGLVFPNIRQLLPLVMEQTHEDPSLIREESVGPFKHRIDDGLQVRKGAYETLYSLMEIALSRIDLVQLYDRVVAGLADDHDIRTLCNLMITKLLVLAADETALRLGSISQQFTTVLNIQLKETAVKQEHEKLDESKKGVIKASIALNHAFGAEATGGALRGAGSGANSSTWTTYWDWMKKEHGPLLKEVEKEEKDRS